MTRHWYSTQFFEDPESTIKKSKIGQTGFYQSEASIQQKKQHSEVAQQNDENICELFIQHIQKIPVPQKLNNTKPTILVNK